MGKATILVIEDDRKVAELARMYLERDGFIVKISHDGYEGLELARQEQPALIVLDLMLPALNGLDICRILRSDEDSQHIPIIMLTAKSTEEDKLTGIDVGADDYITKPFSPRELAARVKMVLRRVKLDETNSQNEQIVAGDLIVNLARLEVKLNGKLVSLTPKEFNILKVLAQAPGRPFSRDDLMNKAFGYDYEGLARTVDVHVMKLRKKIEPDISQPRYIQTVYGFGYKFGEESGR